MRNENIGDVRCGYCCISVGARRPSHTSCCSESYHLDPDPPLNCSPDCPLATSSTSSPTSARISSNGFLVFKYCTSSSNTTRKATAAVLLPFSSYSLTLFREPRNGFSGSQEKDKSIELQDIILKVCLVCFLAATIGR